MTTFTDSSASAAASAVPMEEDENRAPAEATKDPAKEGAATPGADGKATDMTRCVSGAVHEWGGFGH